MNATQIEAAPALSPAPETSATPWGYMTFGDGSRIYDANEEIVADVDGATNAALIVRAVNSHAALVAAVEGILAQSAKHSRPIGQAFSAAQFAEDPDTAKAFIAARAALAAAKGEA